jgi:hypothetical protein
LTPINLCGAARFFRQWPYNATLTLLARGAPMTTMTAGFIGGLAIMAIMGLVCGYYTLKLVLLIEKSESERDRQKGSTDPSQPDINKQ